METVTRSKLRVTSYYENSSWLMFSFAAGRRQPVGNSG
jgi:hypothetical protein